MFLSRSKFSIAVRNRAAIHVLPHLWFRNRWSWKKDSEKPHLKQISDAAIEASGLYFGKRFLYFEKPDEILFCENETNTQKLYNTPNASIYAKDGINEYVVKGNKSAVNPEKNGTKAAAHYRLEIASGESKIIKLRLTDQEFAGAKGKKSAENIFKDFDKIFALRQKEADEFYAEIVPNDLSNDAKNVMRQSLAGMIWSKQYYHYVIKIWLEGDDASARAARKSAKRDAIRNGRIFLTPT